MTKRITVELTEEKFWHIWRGVGFLMEDYVDEWLADSAKENKRVAKLNAYYQRLQDEIAKQIHAQKRAE